MIPGGSEPFSALASTVLPIEVDGLRDLKAVRDRFSLEAVAGCRLADHRVRDFILAANELTTNAILHGRRPVRVQLWVGPSRIDCTVTDHGPGFDALPDVAPPALTDDAGDDAGMGLVLARQSCDELTVQWGDGAFSVRCSTGRPGSVGIETT